MKKKEEILGKYCKSDLTSNYGTVSLVPSEILSNTLDESDCMN